MKRDYLIAGGFENSGDHVIKKFDRTEEGVQFIYLQNLDKVEITVL